MAEVIKQHAKKENNLKSKIKLLSCNTKR